MSNLKNLPRRSANFVASELAFSNLICKGYLLKKNRWFNKQIRYFQLYQNGELKYFKDQTKYKGKITLAKNTKVLKTGKNQMEIPLIDKTYVFLECDRKDQLEIGGDPHGNEENFTYDIDKWIEAVQEVVDNL